MLLKFKAKKLFIIAYAIPGLQKKKKKEKTENICEKKYLYTLFYPRHGMIVYFTEILKKFNIYVVFILLYDAL